MAAGVSIADAKAQRWLNVLSVALFFMLVTWCGGVHSFDYEEDNCPTGCVCTNIEEEHDIPRRLINCAVSTFDRNFNLNNFVYGNPIGWAHFACSFEKTGVTPPDSTLWEGAFSGLEQLRELIFNNCYFKRMQGTAFKGLVNLVRLVIFGADISVLDSELLTFTPSLDSLQVAASGVTLVPALCRTGTDLRVLNLSSNALPSFDAAGVRCTGQGNDGTRAPPLAGLETLDLCNNMIDSWPKWLGKSLPGLEYLAVGNNRIASLYEATLYDLPMLNYFDMSNNLITSIDANFFRGASRRLETVILSKNKVRSLPDSLLSGLFTLRHVELSAMDLNDHVWTQLGHMMDLLHLDLSHNRLRGLDQIVLYNLTILETLRLDHNQIDRLPGEAFMKQSRLSSLDLSHNQLQVVQTQVFSASSELRYLSLQSNRISHLENGVFEHNKRLLELDLSHNLLTLLPNQLFSVQRNLQKLNLSYNEVTSLEPNFYTGLLDLTSLDISNNQLIDLTEESLPKQLEYLDLSYNNISEVSSKMFSGVKKIKLIDLSHNRLKTLPYQPFLGYSELRYLDLSHNEISLVEEFTFSGAENLEELNLSYNKLSSIIGLFTGLKNLKTLNLSWNKLKEIYSFPARIEHIDLSNNIIGSIRDSTFKSLSRIKTVDLTSNNLTTIHRNGVEISYNLLTKPEFVLSFNPLVCNCDLGWLRDYIMEPNKETNSLPNFRSSNRLNCKSPFTGESIRVAETDRSTFLCKYERFCSDGCSCCKFSLCHCVYNCPTGCQCFRGDSIMKVQRVECQSAGLTKLPSLPDGATEVRLDGNNISDFPKFTFLAMKDALDVFLNHSHLQTIHNCSFWGMKVAQRLHLNDNLLSEIPLGAFTGLYELKQLYLHNNNLHLIETGALLAPPFLRTLTLHSNHLVTLTVDDLYELVNRSNYSIIYSNRSCSRSRRDVSNGGTSLTLRNNPWSCEPNFACSFLGYLQANSEFIEDLQFIRCIPEPQIVAFVPENGIVLGKENSHRTNRSFLTRNTSAGRKILDLQLDVCSKGLGSDNQSMGNITGVHINVETSDSKKYVLIASCALVVLVLALIVAVFVNRHLLQVICFTRFGCRAFKPGKNADKKDAEGDERPYDAFICHSTKDDDFVLQQLAPRLENGDKPFRLCIYYRDIPGGAYMGDSIVRSVQASKRTILVLSENFLQSEYCKFEFQVAHEQLMRERKSRMIILLLGNLDPGKVKDDDLKLYLRTRTFLRVGEPLFWQKLIFAMPDLNIQEQRRRASMKGKTVDAADTTCLPSTRDLEYMDRERRMSEQQQLQQQLEQQHLFELQQQQILLQDQHPQLIAQTPLIQYPHHMYPPHHQHHHHEHHQHLLLHHHHHNLHHPQYMPSHYEEQQSHPHHQQAFFHNHLYPPNPHPYTQQAQQHQEQAVECQRPSRQEMYEIPSLDSPPDSQYRINKTSGVVQDSLTKVLPGYPGVDSFQGQSGENAILRRKEGEGGGDGRGSSGSGSLKSTHVNSAFNNSDDSSTSGYHNGSADCYSICDHYEEVGPGSASVMNTPIKIFDQRQLPPVPQIPKEGFIPIDRDDSVNMC